MKSDENATVVTLESTKTRMATVARLRSLGLETYLLTHLPSDLRIEVADITTKIKTPSEAATARIAIAREARTEKRRLVTAKSALCPLSFPSMWLAERIARSYIPNQVATRSETTNQHSLHVSDFQMTRTIIESESDRRRITKKYRKRKKTATAHDIASVRRKGQSLTTTNHHGKRSPRRKRWRSPGLCHHLKDRK